MLYQLSYFRIALAFTFDGYCLTLVGGDGFEPPKSTDS